MQKVEIVRGRSLTLDISVIDVYGNAYELTDGQTLVFGVKRNPDDEELLIRKLVTSGTEGIYRVTLVPTDTESLEPGRYEYDVGLADGTAYHCVIEPNPFIVKANVTKRGDANG